MDKDSTEDHLPPLADIIALMKEHELTRLEFHANGLPKRIEREPDVHIDPPPTVPAPANGADAAYTGALAELMAARQGREARRARRTEQ